MRVDLRTLRRLVREAAMTATTLPADVGLIVREFRGGVTLALVRLPTVESVLSGQESRPRAALNRAIVGSISAHKFDVWRVTNVRAQRGHGPLLYRLAMQYATQRGSSLSSDPDGQTSPDAQVVWDKFATQPDVEVEFLSGEHDDQRDVGYCLEGDDISGLAQRYASLLARYDRRDRDRLDDLLDGLDGALVVSMRNSGS